MVFLGFFWFCLMGYSSWGAPLTVADNPSLPTPVPLIRSLIDFKEGVEPLIHYAAIQTADALNSCPVESGPANVTALLSLLTSKIKGSISKIQKGGAAHCEALEKRLTAASSKVATTLSYQFVTENSETQAQINRATQKASATNELVLTVSAMFQVECLNSADDRVVVQKLLSQLVSLGGIFTGGWQGSVAASGGQFLGSLPLFSSNADKALTVFRRFEEKQERSSFLCLYRQMQKMNCLLFTTPEENVIAGVDIKGESGPYWVTKNSIEKIKNESPAAFADVVLLSELSRNTGVFLSMMEKPEALASGSIDGLLELKKWCFGHSINSFESPSNFSMNLQQSLTGIRSTCLAFTEFKWEIANTAELVPLLFDSYWQMLFLKTFYDSILQSVIRSGEEGLGFIGQTWESLRYFENLAKSLEKLQNPASGNQFRINYHKLVINLGETLAKKSLRSLMQENHAIHTQSIEIRTRSLLAQLNLCQTLDPTLACLYVDRPYSNKLQLQWKKWCVGPKSPLCRREQGAEINKDTLLINPSDRTYFDSLCGH